LQQPQSHLQERKHLDNLIAEQRRTNRMLQTILYLCIGFVMASVALQLLMHLDLL
jgi:ubiquinone biosynthesis protein